MAFKMKSMARKQTQMVQSLQQEDEEEKEKSPGLEDEVVETRKLVQDQNRKKKKSGGFQSMGLSQAVFKGVLKKGYKIPTPIQRKTIPVIMEGRDVVAMARTGSGKTAAFLIPMLEHLKIHSSEVGARGLILSPTRELALQTLHFTKDLGKFTDLKAAVILGGDRMEDQFSALHSNPDIIIATPGRFLHVIMEMGLKLKSMEYIVFDEADRLFEMGFQEQLHEILFKLPDSRQTLLFSATLPKLLVNFAKAGLQNPMLIRLDVDSKLSDQLQTAYFFCHAEDKLSVLLHLLKTVIKPTQQTLIFAATKHHVEYIVLVLKMNGIDSTYVFSSLDSSARKINIAKFQVKRVMVMVVTDLAARGLDIPMLDNVINYHFPGKPKLFVHRVGRVARAGRSGKAYSLIASDEIPYLIDLHMFLGRSFKVACVDQQDIQGEDEEDGVFGKVPQILIDSLDDKLQLSHKKSIDLENLKKVCINGYKQYRKSRPAPAAESVKRMKKLDKGGLIIGTHPLFSSLALSVEEERSKLLDALKNYKASSTVFEINPTMKKEAFGVMKRKRKLHQNVITERQRSLWEDAESKKAKTIQMVHELETTNQDLHKTFSTMVASAAAMGRWKKTRGVQIKDEENYLSYQPSDFQSEKGLVVSQFQQQAAVNSFDIIGDEMDSMKKMSFRKKCYKKWRQCQKTDHNNEMNEEENGKQFQVVGTRQGRKWHTKGSKKDPDARRKQHRSNAPCRSELRNAEQILKNRKVKAKKAAYMQHRKDRKQRKLKRHKR